MIKTPGELRERPHRQARWPAHLPAGALRVVRWSGRYEETVTFYRDAIGLPVLETFDHRYGLDGTILGLPGGQVHLEIVRAGQASYPGGGLDQLVFYLPDAAAREQMEARLAAAGARPVPPDRLLAGQRRCHLPGPGRAGSSVRILDLYSARMLR